MTLIPRKSDPTLIAMNKAIEEIANKEKPRDYLGASSVGDECMRKLWYRYNNYECKPFDAITLKRFDDGHRTEDLVIKRLKLVEGIEIFNIDKDGKQFGFSDFDGKFKGHVDGVIRGLLQAPKTPHILEVKCTKELNLFIKIKEKYGEKSALEMWNFIYYVQAQLYMHYFKMKRHYLIVASEGGREETSCRTDYDKAIALEYIDRAKKIINSKIQPARMSNHSDFYKCRWCEFNKECHR